MTRDNLTLHINGSEYVIRRVDQEKPSKQDLQRGVEFVIDYINTHDLTGDLTVLVYGTGHIALDVQTVYSLRPSELQNWEFEEIASRRPVFNHLEDGK